LLGPIDGIPQAFLSFRFVDIIVITVHDRFWNVGQANCILKYFETMMTDHRWILILFSKSKRGVFFFNNSGKEKKN
jgi:hypothetical protein